MKIVITVLVPINVLYVDYIFDHAVYFRSAFP